MPDSVILAPLFLGGDEEPTPLGHHLQGDRSSSSDDIHTHYARHLIQSNIRLSPISNQTSLTRIEQDVSLQSPSPVGIMGAGLGGLYAAMILKSLRIPYQILEASDRTGGRFYTHRFPDGDYFDVGAMRFPKVPALEPLFHLFNHEALNSNGRHLRELVVPYTFRHPNNFIMVNRVRHRLHARPPPPADAFHQGVANGGNVEPYYIEIGYSGLLKESLQGILTTLHTYPVAGSVSLRAFDQYSVRGFLADCKKLPLHIIEWCEGDSGIFDNSFVGLVLGAMIYRDRPTWYRLEGGAQVLTDYMTQYLCDVPYEINPQPLLLNTAVTAIHPLSPGGGLSLTITDGSTLQFQHVISTIPVTCLRTIDMEDCIDYEQRNAILRLQVEPAVKIGVKFKTAWWKSMMNGDGETLDIQGGQSYTDLSLNNVIYPSSSTSTTLIAAYTASRNATLLGSLIDSGDVADAVLKNLVLKDLAVLHNVEIAGLQAEYVSHFAFDWGHNPLSRGAFTSFGPGQLSTLYPALTRPAAGGRLHFAGEASSIRHAWASGAIEASWRAVAEILLLSYPQKLPLFLQLWPELGAEWSEGGDLNMLVQHMAANSGLVS